MMRNSIKQWYLIHKWMSLICTAFMLLLCLTGLPLIFADEIDRALGYSMAPPDLPETAERADLDTIISAAKARRPAMPCNLSWPTRTSLIYGLCAWPRAWRRQSPRRFTRSTPAPAIICISIRWTRAS